MSNRYLGYWESLQASMSFEMLMGAIGLVTALHELLVNH